MTYINEIIEKVSSGICNNSFVVIVGKSSSSNDYLHNMLNSIEQEGHIKECNIISAEELMYALIEALAEKQPDKWRKALIESKAIIIDGFEYVSRKFSLQKELIDVFKQVQCPVIVATEIPINSKNGFLDDIVTWFDSGICIDKSH